MPEPPVNRRKDAGPSTLAVHAGEDRVKPGFAITDPIFASSTYTFANTQAIVDFLEEGQTREEYGRYGNPGEKVVEDKLAALDAGEIGGAGLDVVPVEPLPKDSPLLGRDNLILSPHTGFYSEDALLELQTKAASDVASVLKGEKPVYPVNPEALK